MSESTEAPGADDGGEDSSVITSLRKQLAKAEAVAKSATEENDSFREARSQARSAAVEAAVNGQPYPASVVDLLKAQVETASDEEFAKLLQDLVPSGDGDEGVQESNDGGETPPQTAVGGIGQQVAAAATGSAGDVDVMKELMEADSLAEVEAITAKHGLDKF